jgi:DNA-binding transcriptional ArsR family regulator
MKPINETAKKTAEILKALGHPNRIEIVRLLSKKKDRKISVGQIQDSLDLTQVETSRHLIILKNASILSLDKEGTNSFYSINNRDPFIQRITLCLMKS